MAQNTTEALTTITEELVTNINLSQLLIDLSKFILIILVGIIVGKAIKYFMRKLATQLDAQKIFKENLIDLLLTILKWAIYLIFVHLALQQLHIPFLSEYIADIIGIVPLLLASFIIIVAGFTIASFIKTIIKKTKNQDWNVLANILYYFTIYVSLLFSIRIFFQEETTLFVGISLIFSIAAAIFILYNTTIKKK